MSPAVVCFLVLAALLGLTEAQLTEGKEAAKFYVKASYPRKSDYSHYGLEAECYTGVGENYFGKQNYTNTGRPCIDWQQTNYKDQASCVYCRNPTLDKKGPWCYVGDDVNANVKQYCSKQIPKCGPVYSMSGEGRVLYEAGSKMATNQTSISIALAPKPSSNRTVYSILELQGFGQTSIHLTYTYTGTAGYITLQWKYMYYEEAYLLQSELSPDKYISLEVRRNRQDLVMEVNGVEYSANGTFPANPFDFTGHFFVAHSHGGGASFQGCMTDMEYDGIRPLDNLVASTNTQDFPYVTISGNVVASDTCMYVAPSTFTPPPYNTATTLHHIPIWVLGAAALGLL